MALYGTISPDNTLGFRNRIINGDMRIDQRNAGVAVSNNGFSVDRFAVFRDGSTVGLTFQQSTIAPTGFTNSLLVTTTTSGTAGVGEGVGFQQRIEGTNISDLAWGTADAKTITLSFWVRSSLTGTFGGSVTNSAFNRAYPYTFSISAADTWEYKTVTIPGDTSGTWLTTNGTGIRVYWDMGSGTNYKNTAGAWVGTGEVGVTGAVNLVGTNGATFYITGVQLEAGSVATPFERRPYGTELQLCMRYFERTYPAQYPFISGTYYSSESYHHWYFKVEKRATPTWAFVGSWSVAPQSAWTSTTQVLLGHSSSYFYGTATAYGTASAEL